MATGTGIILLAMKHREAERLFREYLEMRGWSFWDEPQFRQMMNLQPDKAAPDFTILTGEGDPAAFVEVSEVAIKQEDIQSIQEIIRSPNKIVIEQPSRRRFYHKLKNEINQLKRVINYQRQQKGQPLLPAMLVVYDSLGTVYPNWQFVLSELLGLAITYKIDPLRGEAASPGQIVPTEQGFFFQFAHANSHLSAIALLEEKRVLAILSGYENELKELDYQNLSAAIPKVARITKKYLENGINIEYAVPVLTIFCNPFAEVSWPETLWGPYDRVWGRRNDSYAILYDGLIDLYQGTLRGVSLPPPEQTSRASGFYDE
jgi:hypothetical protein